jgi:hypothetical protein
MIKIEIGKKKRLILPVLNEKEGVREEKTIISSRDKGKRASMGRIKYSIRDISFPFDAVKQRDSR